MPVARGWLVTAIMVACHIPGQIPGAIAAGNNAAQFFQKACAPCHGVEGRGDGPISAELVIPPPDLTLIAQRSGGIFPRDDVYEKIEGLKMPDAHGSSEMPVWGALILFEELGSSTSTADAKLAETHTRERLQGLVDYLESVQRD